MSEYTKDQAIELALQEKLKFCKLVAKSVEEMPLTEEGRKELIGKLSAPDMVSVELTSEDNVVIRNVPVIRTRMLNQALGQLMEKVLKDINDRADASTGRARAALRNLAGELSR